MSGLSAKYISAYAFFMSLALAACGQGTLENTNPSGYSANSSVSESSVNRGSLIIYSGRSESLVGPIIDSFREATEFDVKVKYGKTSEIAATILEEGSNSPADVFFSQDTIGLASLNHMMQILPSEILELSPNRTNSSNGKWVGVSARARVVVYNHTTVNKDNLPETLLGFTDPKWNGRIGWAPSNASFQTMVTVMRTQWGESETEQWLKGVLSNNPKTYPKNTPIVAATASGEIDVGFVNHYYLFRFIAENGPDFGAKNHYLDGSGPGSHVFVSGAGILKTAKNKDNAKSFLRFLLSEEGQRYFANETYEYPLVESVKTHPDLHPIENLNIQTIGLTSTDELKYTQRLLRKLNIIP